MTFGVGSYKRNNYEGFRGEENQNEHVPHDGWSARDDRSGTSPDIAVSLPRSATARFWAVCASKHADAGARMRLHTYWRSTTAYRVRAVLHLKGIDFVSVPVDLVAGDQRAQSYVDLNPGKGVPTLEIGDGTVLTQSLAIIDYLDAICPEPAMVPSDPLRRSRVLAVASAIATDIHPVNNLRVIGQLKSRFDADADQCRDWMHHWMSEGFDTVAALVDPHARFAFNDSAPDLADVCLVAQVYNAHRWGLALDRWPRINAIETACLALPAFKAAYPDVQTDAKEVI